MIFLKKKKQIPCSSEQIKWMQNDYLFWRKGEFCGVQSIRYGAMFEKEVNITQSLQFVQNTTKIHTQAASTNWMKNLPRLSGLSPSKVVTRASEHSLKRNTHNNINSNTWNPQIKNNIQPTRTTNDYPKYQIEKGTQSKPGAKACEDPPPSEQPCSCRSPPCRLRQSHDFPRVSAEVSPVHYNLTGIPRISHWWTYSAVSFPTKSSHT